MCLMQSQGECKLIPVPLNTCASRSKANGNALRCRCLMHSYLSNLVLTSVAHFISVCRASNLAEARCLLFSSAGLIACKDVGLFEAFSCPWPPSPIFYTLREIERPV